MSRSLLFLLTLITPPLAACGGADPEPQTQAQEIPDPAPGTETLPTEEVGESTPPPATQPARQPEPEAPSAQRPSEVGPRETPPPRAVVTPSPPPTVAPPPERESHTPSLVPPPPPRPVVAVLPRGSVLEVRLAQALSSEKDQTGDTFEAILDKDLVVDKQVVARQGNRVQGHLLNVVQSGKVGGRAEMTISLSALGPAEDSYPIETSEINIRAEGSRGRDAKVIGAGGGIGALVGGLIGGKKGAAIGAAIGGGAGTARVLTTRGKTVEFQEEQLFSFRLEKDVRMQLR